MADVTVKDLAKNVGVTEERLLALIKEAGLTHTSADEPITPEDKNTLLMFVVLTACLLVTHARSPRDFAAALELPVES